MKEFLWRLKTNKQRMASNEGQGSYKESRRALSKQSKEELVNTVLALTFMLYQDMDLKEKK